MFGADEATTGKPWWSLPRTVWMPAVAIAIAAIFWMSRGTPDTVPPEVPAQSAPAASAAAPPPPVPAPAAPPVEPHRLRIDLATTRNVWLRVTVDGRVALERELGPGEKLPFGADHSIVIRAGDAGAVSVTVGGEDRGPLGEDGKVLTRRFDAEPR
jgi:hypothetical protein